LTKLVRNFVQGTTVKLLSIIHIYKLYVYTDAQGMKA